MPYDEDREEQASERSPLLPANTEDDPNGQSSVRQGDRTLSNRRALGLCLSMWALMFILTSNMSMLTTIQSSIATTLGVFSAVSWFTSAYLIAVTSITPIAGRLGKIFSQRTYLLSSIVVQSAGLLLSSQAPTFELFLVGRALTGIGSAAVTPIAIILVTEYVSDRRRGLFFGFINMCYTTGVASGAIVAGALEPIVGWRAIFWLQIPVTMSAAILAFFSIPEADNGPKDGKQVSLARKLLGIDYFGVLTLISSIVLFLYSLAAPKIPIIPLLLALADLVLFIIVEAKWAEDPIVPLEVLKSRGVLLSGLATIGIMTARWGILFYSPVYAIAVRGWSQASAGLMLVPTNAGFALGGILAGWLHIYKQGSFYFSSLATFVLFSASILVVSQISTPDFNIYMYMFVIFTNGLITGAMLNYTLAHVLHLTYTSTHFTVIPLVAMFRGMSGSFGSSICGGIFLRSLTEALERGFTSRNLPMQKELIRKLVGTPRLVQSLSGIEHTIAIEGYMAAFRVLFLTGSALSLAMLIFQAGTGWKSPKESDGRQENAADISQDTSSTVAPREVGVN